MCFNVYFWGNFFTTRKIYLRMCFGVFIEIKSRCQQSSHFDFWKCIKIKMFSKACIVNINSKGGTREDWSPSPPLNFWFCTYILARNLSFHIFFLNKSSLKKISFRPHWISRMWISSFMLRLIHYSGVKTTQYWIMILTNFVILSISLGIGKYHMNI